MYDREYAGQKINFEASGGLIHSSLVMQDRETDTYWAIMSGEAIAGKLKGNKLKELPIGAKMQWKDWVKKHPGTLVLSINGKEDEPYNPYMGYFTSDQGFRGTRAKDKRFKTKQPIFTFHYKGQSFAVPHHEITGGKSFDLGDTHLFLYRPPKSEIFYSTAAFLTEGAGFVKQDGGWVDSDSGCLFNPENGEFESGEKPCPERFHGFDTFWYNWSLANPHTKILGN